jgi:hypothetical protein
MLCKYRLCKAVGVSAGFIFTVLHDQEGDFMLCTRRPPPPKFFSTRTRALAPILIALAGCGSGGGDSIPFDEYLARIEAAECEIQVTCGAAPDQATCLAATFVDQKSPALTAIAAVARGTVIYDGQLAAKCLAALDQGCAVNSVSPPECLEILRGTVPTSGACVASAECADGGQCVMPPGCTTACCAGTCGGPSLVPIGGDCSGGSSPCASAGYCSGGTCVAKASLGAACTETMPCASPGVCNVADGAAQPGVCVIAPDEGAACDSSLPQPCMRTYDYCDSTSLKCIKRKQPGDACSPDAACVAYAPCRDGVCTPEGLAGQPCDDAAGSYCFDDLICTAGACVAPPAGVACTPA